MTGPTENVGIMDWTEGEVFEMGGVELSSVSAPVTNGIRDVGPGYSGNANGAMLEGSTLSPRL